MERCPFGDESHGARRQCPRDDRQTVDCDPSFVFSVFSVKVRGLVIGEVHLDDDAVEAQISGMHRLECGKDVLRGFARQP